MLAVSDRNKKNISDLKNIDVYFSVMKVQHWFHDSAPQGSQRLGGSSSTLYHH